MAGSSPTLGALKSTTAAGGAEFADRNELKDHYDSEYHRYNLKRKVAGLPLLTLEQFERRQAQEAAKPSGMLPKQAKKANRKEARNAKKQERLEMKVAKVQVAKEMAEREEKIARGEEVEDWDEYSEEEDEESEEEMEEVEIFPGQSLFDNEMFEDWPTCLEYMESKFGFTIPHLDKVKNMDEMCAYLQLKINICFRCLYSQKRFRSAEAVKHYMSAKGNQRFNSDTFEIEFGRFYGRIADSRKEERQRLALAEQGAWGDGEEGVTASGKKLVPRDLAWVVKQKPKPAESHTGTLLAQKEEQERTLRAYGDLSGGMFQRTIKSEMTKQDMHRQSKSLQRLGVKQNKLFKLPSASLLYGR